MKYAPSQFTVNQLKTSLSELMEVKDFHTISVNELCTSAGISRSTFYRDFSSVTDIRDMLYTLRQRLHSEAFFHGFYPSGQSLCL